MVGFQEYFSDHSLEPMGQDEAGLGQFFLSKYFFFWKRNLLDGLMMIFCGFFEVPPAQSASCTVRLGVDKNEHGTSLGMFLLFDARLSAAAMSSFA